MCLKAGKKSATGGICSQFAKRNDLVEPPRAEHTGYLGIMTTPSQRRTRLGYRCVNNKKI